jgi:hypothetical protein
MTTYGNISNVIVFATEQKFNEAVRLLTENGNGFENSGYPLALNFYLDDPHYSFPYAMTDLEIAGFKDGVDFKVVYR